MTVCYANQNSIEEIEFYSIKVPDGPLTSKLQKKIIESDIQDIVDFLLDNFDELNLHLYFVLLFNISTLLLECNFFFNFNQQLLNNYNNSTAVAESSP